MGNVQWPFKVRATDIVSRHTNKPPAQIVNWQVVAVSFPPQRYHRYALQIFIDSFGSSCFDLFFHLAYLSCDVDLWPQDNNHLANETLTKTRTKTKAQLQLHSMQGMQGVKEVGGGLTRCAPTIVGQRRRCSRLERSAAGREAFPVGCG